MDKDKVKIIKNVVQKIKPILQYYIVCAQILETP